MNVNGINSPVDAKDVVIEPAALKVDTEPDANVPLLEEKGVCRRMAFALLSWIKSHQLLLQALFAWGLVCLPGNVVTLFFYFQVGSIAPSTLHHVNETSIMDTKALCEKLLEQKICVDRLRLTSESCHLGTFMTSNSSLEVTLEEALCFDSNTKETDCLEMLTRLSSNELRERCQRSPNQTSKIEEKEPPEYLCHEPYDTHHQWMESSQFWLEGVAVLVVGIFGTLGNLITILVLRRIETNVMFNKLLMSLAISDTLFLLYYIMDYGVIGTFMRSYGTPEPLWYRLSYPYVLWPLKWIFMSSTIFMVMAISIERYRAICSPLTHRPAFWPYIGVVIITAVVFNVPKFFEFQPEVTSAGEDDYTTTPLNEVKGYIVFCSWWNDLFVYGLIPFLLLVGCNLKIYFKVRSSDKLEYRFVGRRVNQQSQKMNDVSHLQRGSSNKMKEAEEIELVEMPSSSRSDGMGRDGSSKTQKSFAESVTNADEAATNGGHSVGRIKRACSERRRPPVSRRRLSEIELDPTYQKNEDRPRQTNTIRFQKRGEKSARVLITIVLTFLCCHTFRFVMKFYEVTHPSHSTEEHHVYCSQRDRFHVPVILYIMLSLHHLLLVVNSSVNFIIYCCVGKRFRQELKDMVAPYCRQICHLCDKSPREENDLHWG